MKDEQSLEAGKEIVLSERKWRDVALDMLKGLCILLVVYGHLPRTGYLSEHLEAFVRFIYTFHMPIFVVVSGFLFSRSSKSALKIVNRLVKPYFVMALVFIPLMMLAKRPADATFGSMLCGVVTGHAGGALWYLYDLAIAELLALGGCVAICKFKKVPVKIRSALECVSVAVSVVMGWELLHLMGEIYLMRSWFYVYFIGGYVCGKVCREFPASVWGSIGVAASVIFLNIGRDNYIWVLSLVVFLVWLFRNMADTTLAKGLSYLGRHSLALMLFHPVFNHVVNPTFAYVLRLEGSGIVVGLLSLASNVALCLALEYGISKTPLARVVL